MFKKTGGILVVIGESILDIAMLLNFIDILGVRQGYVIHKVLRKTRKNPELSKSLISRINSIIAFEQDEEIRKTYDFIIELIEKNSVKV